MEKESCSLKLCSQVALVSCLYLLHIRAELQFKGHRLLLGRPAHVCLMCYSFRDVSVGPMQYTKLQTGSSEHCSSKW